MLRRDRLQLRGAEDSEVRRDPVLDFVEKRLIVELLTCTRADVIAGVTTAPAMRGSTVIILAFGEADAGARLLAHTTCTGACATLQRYADTVACRMLLSYTFEERKLRRAEWRCRSDNARSSAVAARLGMTPDGVLRSTVAQVLHRLSGTAPQRPPRLRISRRARPTAASTSNTAHSIPSNVGSRATNRARATVS